MVPQTAYQGADVAPEPDHRRDSGLAQESHRQYSNARGHREAQISSIDDLKSVLLQGLRTGVFDDLIREALPTGSEEREALRRYLQHLLMCVVRCALCVVVILEKKYIGVPAGSHPLQKKMVLFTPCCSIYQS